MTIARILFGLFLSSAVSPSAYGCILCLAPCPNTGLCTSQPRSSGWSSCDVACQCPTPQEDCGVGISKPLGAQVSCPVDFFPMKRLSINEEPTLGLVIAKIRKGTVVENILTGSNAFYQGLRPGDRVLSINGTDVAQLSFARIARLLDGSSHSSVSIVVGTKKRTYFLSPETLSSINARILAPRSKVAASAFTGTQMAVTP